jgi:hypothetical protein
VRSLLILSIAHLILASCGGDETHEIPPEPVCATPLFAPPPGSYGSPTAVTITTVTEGATIRYTLDGTTPVETSTLYEQPVTIATTKLLQARAWKSGFQPSDVATGAYSIAGAPCSLDVVSPAGGEIWTAGSHHAIGWESAGCGASVRIDLLREGTACLVIAASAPNTGTYDWLVAGCGSGTSGYRVRVTDVAGEAHAESAADFQIAEGCAIQVLSPNGGESWTLGSPHEITWTAAEACGAQVRIDLVREDAVCGTIAESTENDGAFPWSVAGCESPLDGYSVRVTDIETDAVDSSDASFSLLPPTCTIAVQEPDGGESWDAGFSNEILWQSSGCGPTVRIDLFRDGVFCASIADSAENDGRYDWIADRCESEDFGYRVRVTDRASGVADDSDGSFSIFGPSCSLTLLSPNGGEVWEEGTEHEITWSSDGCHPPLEIDLLRNGELCMPLWSGGPGAEGFLWRVERCGGETDGYTIRLTASGTGAESGAPFTITPAAVPCEMTVTAPDSGAVLWNGSRHTIQWTRSNCGTLATVELLCGGAACWSRDVGNGGAYEWAVGACCADSCTHTVRVTDMASNVAAESGPFCIRTCEVAVTSPAEQDTWLTGETRTIAWNTLGCGSEVRLDLYTDEGFLCLPIAEGTANDGAFDWTVEKCVDVETYHVLVTDLTSEAAGLSERFHILEPNPCILSVTSPNGGERWPAGSARAITWNAAGCGPNVRIDLFYQNVECSTLAESAPNTGSFEWTVDACRSDSTDYRIAVTDIEHEVSDQSDAAFMIPSCDITLDSPVGGERWQEGSPQTIAWHSSGACSGPVRIDLVCNEEECRTIAASTEDDGSLEWTAAACCDDPCAHRIRITNLASAVAAESPADFCICPPCVPTVTAPNGGEEWKAGSTHAITWNPANCGESVLLELLRDGVFCRTIHTAAPNTGAYEWSVEGCEGGTGGYAVRVTGPCGTADTSDAAFTIPECRLEVTSPAAGETWAPGSGHDITWTSSECGGTVRIELWKLGNLCATLTAGTPDDGSFGWTAQPCESGSGCGYQIRVVDTETQRIGVMTGSFCICPPCAPVVVVPSGGEIWQEGSGFDIVWTPSACDASVRLDLTRGGSICGTISDDTPNDGLFHWTAARCGTETAGYRVMVTGLGCGQSDTTDADFTIPPMPCSLDLVSPDGGESWSRNTTHLIRWDTAGDCGEIVKIELLRNGLPCLTIAEATANDGTHGWTALTCGEEETGYAIRVTELTGNRTTQSAAPFSIPICRLAVTAPNGGESWMAETQQTISWDANAACGSSVRIELLRDNAPCLVIDDAAPNSGVYSWIPQNCNAIAEGYRIRVTDSATGVSDTSDADFRIPTPPCSIAVIAPNGGESWVEGSTHAITWSSAHCGESVRIDLLSGGTSCSVIALSTPNTGTITWNVESCAGASGPWKIRVTDLVSQAADESDQAFLIPVSAEAYILPQNLSACRGEQNVEILVRGRNSQALQGYGVSICYDTAVFTCTGLSLDGTRGAGAPYFESDCGAGCARAGVIVSNVCPPQMDPGDGPLLRLTLSVKAGAPLGETILDLRSNDPATNTMARCDGTGVDPVLVDGRITICGGPSR